MKLQELNKKSAKLSAKQVKQLLILVATQVRMKKRELTTGFKGA